MGLQHPILNLSLWSDDSQFPRRLDSHWGPDGFPLAIKAQDVPPEAGEQLVQYSRAIFFSLENMGLSENVGLIFPMIASHFS